MLVELAALRPDLKVEQGAPPMLRWAAFLGSLAVGAALLLPINLLLDRRDAADLWWIAALLGVTLIATLVVAWRNRPWRVASAVAVRDLVESISSAASESA